MQIITTAIIKGGTGKTTTAAALCQAAAAAGKKVLAVDLDPQASLSFTIGADQTLPGSYQLLQGEDAAQLVQRTPQGIDCIAGSPDLAAEHTTPGSAKRLRAALDPLRSKYDFIIIDTPPTMGELTFNALQASTGLLIPLEADTMSIQGLYNIADIAHHMQRSNPDLQNIGIVISRYNARTKISRHMRGVIEDTGKELGAPLLQEIRPGIAIQEAQAFQQSIFEYAPRSNPAQDYKELYEIVRRERKWQAKKTLQA